MGVLAAMLLAPLPAWAAETPSPQPTAPESSPAPTPGTPSPTPGDGAEPDPTSAPTVGPGLTQDTLDTGLVVGIDRYISYPTTATAIGSRGLASATLPVPAGMVPIVLLGNLVSVADSPGIVRIRVGTKYVELDAVEGGPFRLELPADATIDDAVTVELRNTLDLGQGECVSDTTTTETIQDLRLGFLGVETSPTTVAGFFSPPVQRVTLVVPATVDSAVAEATLATAAALASRYDGTIPIVVTTPEEFDRDPERYDNADGPFRIVRIEPGDQPTSTISVSDPGVPTLTIAGPAADLAVAGAALASTELGLAAVREATELADRQRSYTVPTLTLADLGAPRPSLAGLGRLEFAIPIGQSAFGGPIASASIRLEGAHTPVASNGAAVASILWNGTLVAAQPLDDNDDFLAEAEVPGALIARDNILTIRLDASPPGGNCESGAPIAAQLDVFGATSTVSATPGQSLRNGFERYPQAFGETMRVAFGSGPITPDLVRTASALVASLQRATAQRMNISVVPFAELIGQPYAAMVVGATPADADRLQAPLRFEPWRALDDARTEFTVTVDGPFAALEAFEVDGQNILMLGSTAPTEQAQPLLDQIADEAQSGRFGWFGLGGSILVAQPSADLLTLEPRTLVPQAVVQAEQDSLPVWLFVLGGVILGLIVLRIVWVRLRQRRFARVVSESSAQDVPAAEVTADSEPSPEDPSRP